MDIAQLVATIRITPDCTVYPPAGLPTIRENQVLPDDLREFYLLCGGARLFETAGSYSIDIVPPQKFVIANPVILGELSEDELASSSEDISWSWYIIGEAPNSQYITIDLSQERLGRCCDSFWDIHPGNSTIISTSFTELFVRLLANKGEDWYWCHPEFVSLGDAYDDA